MPTYDYECSACGHAFEAFHSIKADPIKKCPECGKNRVERMIGTGGGVIFKGSGFYETDYRSDSYNQAAKKDGGTSSDSTDTKKEQPSESSTTSKSSNGETSSSDSSNSSDKTSKSSKPAKD